MTNTAGSAEKRAKAISERSKTTLPERDAKGRFLKGGYRGGPGRPPRQVETAYLTLLTTEVKPDYWAAICRRAVADAMKGNAQAREWLGRYLLGDSVASATEIPAVPLTNAADALALLSRAAGLVLGGDVRRGQALASLALAAVRIAEVETLEQRLTALEAALQGGDT